MDHIPVLATEVLELIAEMESAPLTLLDGTFGRGGHSRLIMQTYKDLKVVAFDRDLQAIDFGKSEFKSELEEGRILFIHNEFSKISESKNVWSEFIGSSGFDLILLDLGVSSPQLDIGERGFSFYNDGPLDMRMNQTQKLTAKEIVNEWDEQELSDLFYKYGEIKFPNKVVRAIVKRRGEKNFNSTNELSDLIAQTSGWQKKGHHPATQYFLALRLMVNQELQQVEESLPHLIENLNNKGRILVITFHSLEDRIVKTIFKSSQQGKPSRKKVIQAQWPEKKRNPRARSAKLRVFQREIE